VSTEKKLLVLARRDHAEAMRVAAGLTIFGHAVSLVFMDRPVAETAENAANAELLELTGIEPQTTVARWPTTCRCWMPPASPRPSPRPTRC
jgi:hypothetical protein